MAAARSLRDMIAGSTIESEEAIQLAVEIARELGDAPARESIDPSCISVAADRIEIHRPVPGRPRAYISPEEMAGRAPHTRTDVWLFGCVLYEMLTSRAPFPVGTPDDSQEINLRRTPDVSAVPTRVRPIVKRCLDSRPERRFASLGAVRVALERVLAEAATVAIADIAPQHYWSFRLPLGVVRRFAGTMGNLVASRFRR